CLHLPLFCPDATPPGLCTLPLHDALPISYPVNRSNFTVNMNGQTISFDCVFNIIHGTPGENGLLQAYLELLHIPQTSCDFYQARSEEHTSELQSRENLVCRLLLEKNTGDK